MLGEPIDVPTKTLIDMFFAILGDDVALTARDAENIEQIQRELDRRGNYQDWEFRTLNPRDVLCNISQIFVPA